MAWFKVDDKFHTSRKVLSIPRRHRLAAVGLWTMAGNWSASELTDGKVPAYVLEELGATETLIRALVEARLWLDHRSTEARPTVDRGSTGIEFHNWAEYQPTRAEVEAERAKAAERQRRWREKKAAETDESRVSNAVTNGVSHGVSNGAPTRPDPTRPNKKKTSSSSTAAAAAGFDEFWDTYPRKQDKGRARPAWNKAVKKTDPQTIIKAAKQYASTVDRREGGKYIKLPATWLNAEAWENETNVHPLPPRPSADPEPGTEEWNRRYQPWMFQ